MLKILDGRFKLLDKWIFRPFMILILFSIVAIYSASSYSAMEDYGNPHHYLKRQSIIVGVSLFLSLLVYLLPLHLFRNKKVAQIGTISTILLLLVVFIFDPIKGARRWIPLGSFNLQPAEVAKFFVIWYLAYILSKKQSGLQYNFKNTVLKPGILVSLIALLIVLQPDTGTAIIIIIMAIMIVSASGAPMKYGLSFIALGIALVGSVSLLIYIFGDKLPILGYRYDRFLGLWDPFDYYETHGHQLVNSYYALNRGGLFGVGLGNSVQKTGYLPFPYTDFIISIIGEEFGLVGVSTILVLLGTIIGRSFYLGSKSKDSFNSLIFLGVGSMLLLQSLVNLAGITGLIPITGVTFPFISYGGSSLIIVSMSIALVANASAIEQFNRKMRKK